MDFRTLLARIQNDEHLVHLTHPRNLSSILRRGLLSPREAQSLGALAGMGSKGSNQAVVQLFDLRGLDAVGAVQHIRFVLEESPALLPECLMLLVDSDVRNAGAFVSHWGVQKAAKAQKPALRYYSPTEVWINAPQLEPKYIIEGWKLTAAPKGFLISPVRIDETE